MDDLVNSVFGKNSGSQTTSNIEEFGSDQIKIVTAGFGGAGDNIVNRLLKAGVKGTQLVAVNTDAQHFKVIDDRIKKVLIGKSLTRGLGAGGDPKVGEKAAEVDRHLLEEVFSGAQLVFLCAGMGGGTGTGSIRVAAQIAKEQGAIVICMVTYPFALERVRMVKAEEGIRELTKYSDSVIIIDNNRLVKLVPNLPMPEAFALADSILAKAIGGLVWTITQPSMINIDFADVRSIMSGQGVGFIAVGIGKGNDKVGIAAEQVLKNKLLMMLEPFTPVMIATISIASSPVGIRRAPHLTFARVSIFSVIISPAFIASPIVNDVSPDMCIRAPVAPS